VTFNEAVECFVSNFEVHRNKKFKDRYQLISETIDSRNLKIIFSAQTKTHRTYHHWVADMTGTSKAMKKKPSEEEIDKIVVVQSEDDSAWEEPIRFRRSTAPCLARL